MPSLLGTTGIDGTINTGVAANYLKTKPTTQFGTRILRTIAITIDNAGSNDKDLTTANNAGGSYLDSGSYFSVAVRALQTSAEIYAVYTPSATALVVVVADTTATDSNVDSHTPGGWGNAEAAILTAIHAVDATTKYDGAVAITEGTWTGSSIAFA